MQKNKLLTIASILLVVAFGLGISQCGKKTEGEGDESATEATTEDTAAIEAGKALYKSNGCNACHGDTGLGDGPAGAALNPPARNFHNKDNYKQGSSLAEVSQTLATGVPGTAMVAYASISEEDRNKIAAYVVSLQGK